ncbi:serine hydrolase domain-containing protein [Kribbella pittospori]|uniref:serine hydrolase domain-containing protein n=1 Tax=Kribbella pittospori TaxID=722689 RepID=UPI002353D92A|nr:serine hydrolase domain-containing protein [Kribbella pittospori]
MGDELRRRVPGLLDEHGLPSVAVGVCDSTAVLWSAGFGTTRAGGGEPVTAETAYGMQSCSKMYTATAVLLAVQQGLVELDVPITRYLPEFRVNSSFEDHPERRITLRHLLGHTAGFTHEAPVGSNYLVGRESFQAHCDSISDTWLRFPVGHHHQYSNLGIDLAGYILQCCSGQPFHEFVRRVLLAPLGMKRTTFNPREIMRDPHRAIGHAAGTARVPVRVPMVAAGGLYTSVNDACRYLQFHLTGGASLLDPALLAEMYAAPQPDQGYGLGLALTHAADVPVRGHGGGGFGFLSDMYWAPDEEIGVVVLTNSTNHPLHWELAEEIFRDLIPTRPHRTAPSPKPVTAPTTFQAGTAAAAEGAWNRDYVIRASGVRDGIARLRKENGVLLFDHWAGGTVRLREHLPGLYVSATGEMLDLTRTPPTYANVRLHQH